MFFVKKIRKMSKEHITMPEGKFDSSSHETSNAIATEANTGDVSSTVKELLQRSTTRREALKSFGLGSIAALLINNDRVSASEFTQTPTSGENLFSAIQEEHTEDTSTPVSEHSDSATQNPDQSHQGVDTSHESEHHGRSKANLITAGVNVANFASELGAILTGKSHGFDKKTVLRNTALAGTRVATLSALDKEAMDHDVKEFKGSYPLVPVLVALAEGASNMKVSNDKIYEDHTRMEALIQEIGISGGSSRIVASESSRNIEGFVQLELQNRNGSTVEQGGDVYESHHQIPEVDVDTSNAIDFDDLDVSKDLEAWEGYFEKAQQDIVDSLSQNAATTAIFAPLTTTYSSSAIASENQANIYKRIARFRYVKDVIDVKRLEVTRNSSEYIDRNQVEQLQNDAQEKALDIMNGFGGYNHLSLTLASNTNGMALIGDPPMLFYLSKHGPSEFAELSAKGFAVSEISEIISTYAFLKRAGADVKIPEFVGSYFANQGRTLKRIGQSLTDGALRDVSFNGGRNASKEVTRILQSLEKEDISEDVRNELISKMHETPEPSIFVDPKTLVKNKIESIGKWKGFDSLRETDDDLVSEYMKVFASSDFEDFISYYASEEYSDLVKSDNKEQIKAGLKAMQKLGAKKESSKLTALLESLVLQTHPDSGEYLEENESAEDDKTVPPVDILMKSLTSVDARTDGKPKLKNIFSDLMSITPEEFQKYEQALNNDGEDTVSNLQPEKVEKIKGIYDSFSVLDNEDVRASLEDALLLAEKEEHVHEEEGFLTESASEVMYALTSQLPVVPSWVVMSEELLERSFGAKGGELSRSDVVKQIDALLAEGAGFSMTADNVAAYLFVETVMEKIMIEYYGEEFYRSDHELQEAVWTSSAMIAMVAGANSKYGNGPNLLQYDIDKNLDRHAISLKSTLGNPYAIVQTVATGIGLRTLIHRNMPEKN